MNTHPSHDELVSHLYSELDPHRRDEVSAHLEVCSECRAAHGELCRTLRALDSWQVASPRPPRESFAWPALKWAAAAAVLLGVGIGIGHLTAPRADEASLRRAFQLQLHQVTLGYEQKLDEDRTAIVDILQTMKAQHDTEFAALRSALETVAVNAEDGLRTAAVRIGELATITQPVAPPDPLRVP